MRSIRVLKIFRIVTISLIILFLLSCACLFILLKCCNLSYYVILSGSMQPEIMVDDLVVSKNLSENEVYDDLNEGDIATYFDGKDYITHRVYEKGFDESKGMAMFVFKGDNNNTIDRNTVMANQIRGKYLFSIRNGSGIFGFINSIYGLITLVSILVLLFMIDNTLVYVMNMKILKLKNSSEDENSKNVSEKSDTYKKE